MLASAGGAATLHAQDLAPRAYVITPLGSNALTFSDSYNDGDLLLEGAVPIEDATGRLHAPSVTYYRAFGLFGRSANFIAGLAYGGISRASSSAARPRPTVPASSTRSSASP